MSIMKGRNIVNLIGIPGWLLMIWLGGLYYSIFILLSMSLALGEYYSMAEKKGAKPLRWMGIVSSVFIVDYFYVQPELTSHDLIGVLILITFLIMIWELFSENNNSGLNIAYTLAGILYVSVLLGTSIDLRQFDSLMNTKITLAMVLSVWACDSAAFIFGINFGKKKIFPRVSPKKSWIGSIAGLCASLLTFYLFYHREWLGDIFVLTDVIVLGIIAGGIGQLGDFTESLLKRDVDIKDSSKILLGHGGVLDRFDSLIFASPATYLYIHFLM